MVVMKKGSIKLSLKYRTVSLVSIPYHTVSFYRYPSLMRMERLRPDCVPTSKHLLEYMSSIHLNILMINL